MWKFTYIYPWHITSVTQSLGYWIWTNLNKILCDSIFSNLFLSWAVATDRKFYCKSDDPPWHIKEYPKLCVFYMGALTAISMSKQIQDYIYLYTACLPKFSVKRSNYTHWCAYNFLKTWSSLPTYISTTPSCLRLSAMFTIMKMTYNECFFLKVSKQKLPTDGVSLVMYCLPRIDELYHCIRQLVLSFNSINVIQQFLATDGVSNILKYSKCNNIALFELHLVNFPRNLISTI